MNFNEWFSYDQGKLIHKNKPRLRKDLIGTEAGSLDRTTGYKRLEFRGRLYYVHRVIWEMKNGEITVGMTVDHINGEKTDNRIENLRCVDVQTNQMNLGLSRANTSGFQGVSWDKTRGKWKSSIKYKGRNIFLGRYRCIGMAISARIKANKNFGFHENHGLRHGGN